MRLATTFVLLLACTPSTGPTPHGPSPASSEAREQPDALVDVLAPWHPFDAALAETAPVWLLTRYERGTYPCIVGPDGSLDMIEKDRFMTLKALRGDVKAPAIDLDLYALRGPTYPRAYAEGRRYLLLLRPGSKGQALLADADGRGGMHDRFGSDEVLAAIDLDQTEAEATAEQVPASRSGELGGMHWDPSQWAALRAAETPDPARQRELATFLQGSIVRPRAPLAEVRAWLGPPDRQLLAADGSRTDEYILAYPAYAKPVQGGIYGDLEVRYDARLELRSVELDYLRWRIEPHEQSSVELTDAEHKSLGLPRLQLQFR